jgi:hypothetical protein
MNRLSGLRIENGERRTKQELAGTTGLEPAKKPAKE